MSSVLTKAIIKNSIVVSALESKQIVNRAIRIHGLSPVAAAALGRALTMAALMGNELKNSDDYLTVNINGGGPLGTLTVCADGKFHVKGTVGNPVVETVFKSNGHLDVGSAVGKDGQITVIRDVGLKQPYVGSAKLVSGEIGEDFAYYFAASEQQPCGVALGVGLRNGKCVSAGGVFVQVMPNCPKEILDRVELIMLAMEDVSYHFEHSTAKQVIERFFGELSPEYIQEKTIEYRCNCGKAKINRLIKGLGSDEAYSIVNEVGKIEVCCHFCGKKYVYLRDDVDRLFAEKKH